jgi:5-methylcytosine-specific restriction enzyme subunit McrC
VIEIPLTEGPAWSDSYRLTPAQAAAVYAMKEVEHQPLDDGRWRFRTHQTAPKVGAISVGPDDEPMLFLIKPKIGVARLMFLVEYADHGASARWDDQEITAREEEGLLGAVARAFSRAAQRALRSGVLLGYREIESNETVIRGRIRVGDQALSANPLGPPVAIGYDNFTPDITENRLLLAATRELRQLPELKPDVRHMLAGIEQRLSGVARLRSGEVWTPTRLNVHYYRALNLAELVLRENSYELDEDGGVRADGLLISMPHLYEDFVAGALRRALQPYGDCFPKQKWYLDEGNTLPAETDAAYYASADPDRPAAIIDAKYAVLGGKGRSRRIQQMISYCYRLGASRGFLVYAQGPESGQVSHRIRDIEITEYPLDLTQAPVQLLKQIDALAAVVASP